MKPPQFTLQDIMVAVGCFAIALAVIVFCGAVIRSSVDPETSIFVPVQASPFIAVIAGYGIGRLSGYVVKSVLLSLAVALVVDVYLISRLF